MMTGKTMVMLTMNQSCQVGWVDENWHLEMSFSSDSDLLEPHKSKEYEISTEPESYKNRSLKAEITGLCSSYQYNVCLQLIKDESLKTEPFCQVCVITTITLF